MLNLVISYSLIGGFVGVRGRDEHLTHYLYLGNEDALFCILDLDSFLREKRKILIIINQIKKELFSSFFV